jgi:hypothetical protein
MGGLVGVVGDSGNKATLSHLEFDLGFGKKNNIYSKSLNLIIFSQIIQQSSYSLIVKYISINFQIKILITVFFSSI